MNRCNLAPAVLAGFFLLTSPLVATGAKAQDYYVSEIILTLSPTCPNGSLEADGRKLPINVNANQPLFVLMGTNHGGDARVDFALPDLRNKSQLKGARYCVVYQGIFPSRD